MSTCICYKISTRYDKWKDQRYSFVAEIYTGKLALGGLMINMEPEEPRQGLQILDLGFACKEDLERFIETLSKLRDNWITSVEEQRELNKRGNEKLDREINALEEQLEYLRAQREKQNLTPKP